MSEIPGMKKPDILDLPKVSNRMTFLYLEHCKLSCQDSAITIIDDRGITSIPSGVISVLLLGPGTTISHEAMKLIGVTGVSVCWIGEHGVKYYAGGRPLTASSKLILKQAELVTHQRKHLEVVRKMYLLRFPNEDVSQLTLQQLRGREGSRIRKIYKKYSKKWNVKWDGRIYDHHDYTISDPVNTALSVGHSCLYGIAQAVISAIGCSTALGFVHVGKELSFVYDIADLYKADITIPIAFEVASQAPNNFEELESIVRHKTRNAFYEYKLVERIVHHIKYLFEVSDDDLKDALYLWDNKSHTVDSGKQYGDEL